MISFGDYPAHITPKDHFLIFPFGKNFGLLKILRAQKKFKFSFPDFFVHISWSTLLRALGNLRCSTSVFFLQCIFLRLKAFLRKLAAYFFRILPPCNIETLLECILLDGFCGTRWYASFWSIQFVDCIFLASCMRLFIAILNAFFMHPFYCIFEVHLFGWAFFAFVCNSHWNENLTRQRHN